MDEFHGLLRRQLDRHFGRDHPLPAEWQGFLGAVSEAYRELDTARKMAERSLALSSAELHGAYAELRGVLHLLPDLIFRVGADDRVGGVVRASTIMEYPALQAFTKAGTAVARQFQAVVAEVRSKQAAGAFEYELDGVTHELRLLPFVDSDLIGIVRDISDRKQAERDRLILGKLESTGILAGGIAHDFNNLLTAMLLNVDMARLAGTPPEETDRYLSTIRNGILAAQTLTQQLITFARGGATVRQPTILAALLRESVPLAITGANVGCEVSIADDLWPTEVDLGQIGQVVRNLVLNAREAMPAGGMISLFAHNVMLAVENASALPAGRYVEICVADDGPGIQPEALPRIFDPYFSTKVRGAQKGMGLGLTICHSIVKKHRGAIAVESSVGRGTKFTVYLPASSEPIVTKATAATEFKYARRRGRVLVMDDEAAVRDIFRMVLQQLGYEAEIVADGRQAVASYVSARCQGRPFDAVILDLTVKGEMGGREAIEELTRHDPEIRAVVMSGYSDDDVVCQFERYGFCARLIKPFDRDTLRDVLRQVTAGRE